jgi:hypothetical protein
MSSLLMVRTKPYVFEYFIFVTRRGEYPNHWAWEIRSKNNPDTILADGGFKSAKIAEQAGRIVLGELRRRSSSEPAKVPALKTIWPRKKSVLLLPAQRSDNARKAALARAKSLSPKARAEISRKGGAASKGKAKISRKTGLPIRKNPPPRGS